MPIKRNATVGEVGERGVLRAIASYLSEGGGRVLVGVGDDAAVTAATPGTAMQTVLTTDMLVEGTHFLRGEETDWKALGRKAMASNVSDVAAMAGMPRFALVSLGLPADLKIGCLLELYAGLAQEARQWGAELVGGDTTMSPVMVINIALTGELAEGRPVPLRSRCRAGQKVYLTGDVGRSRAGLELLTDPALQALQREPWVAPLLERHKIPQPRVKAGSALGAALRDLAMIDISDSVMNELHLLAQASAAKLVVYPGLLPVTPEIQRYCALRGNDVATFAMSSGEEYELMFATNATQEQVDAILKHADADAGATCIGEVQQGPASVQWLDGEGVEMQLKNETFAHFSGTNKR